MKSILVIDTPKNCPDCQLMADGLCYGIPSREEVQGKIKYLKRPSWCPLRPLPQKMTMEKALKMERCGSIKDIYTTWDACLAEITGETE